MLDHVVGVLDASKASAAALARHRFAAARSLWPLVDRRSKAKALAALAREGLEGAALEELDRSVEAHR